MHTSIGVDFDNTFVCYDALFFNVALDMSLISGEVQRSKKAVQEHILTHHSNDEWTLLQSEVYGGRMLEAEAYPGVREFLYGCRLLSIPVSIVSHKTQSPAMGKRYDLHQAALGWLEAKGFLAPDDLQLAPDNVHFSATRQAKIQEIVRLGCTCFIDDLPEVFAEDGFPSKIKRVLFDPWDAHVEWREGIRAGSWNQIQKRLLNGNGN